MSFEVESCVEDVKIWQNGIHFFDWLKDYNHCGGKRKWPSQRSYFLCHHSRDLDSNKFHYVPTAVQGKSHLPVINELYVA